MVDQVANRLDLRPAAELLAWIQPVCISIDAVPAQKGLNDCIPSSANFSMQLWIFVVERKDFIWLISIKISPTKCQINLIIFWISKHLCRFKEVQKDPTEAAFNPLPVK